MLSGTFFFQEKNQKIHKFRYLEVVISNRPFPHKYPIFFIIEGENINFYYEVKNYTESFEAYLLFKIPFSDDENFINYFQSNQLDLRVKKQLANTQDFSEERIKYNHYTNFCSGEKALPVYWNLETFQLKNKFRHKPIIAGALLYRKIILDILFDIEHFPSIFSIHQSFSKLRKSNSIIHALIVKSQYHFLTEWFNIYSIRYKDDKANFNRIKSKKKPSVLERLNYLFSIWNQSNRDKLKEEWSKRKSDYEDARDSFKHTNNHIINLYKRIQSIKKYWNQIIFNQDYEFLFNNPIEKQKEVANIPNWFKNREEEQEIILNNVSVAYEQIESSKKFQKELDLEPQFQFDFPFIQKMVQQMTDNLDVFKAFKLHLKYMLGSSRKLLLALLMLIVIILFLIPNILNHYQQNPSPDFLETVKYIVLIFNYPLLIFFVLLNLIGIDKNTIQLFRIKLFMGCVVAWFFLTKSPFFWNLTIDLDIDYFIGFIFIVLVAAFLIYLEVKEQYIQSNWTIFLKIVMITVLALFYSFNIGIASMAVNAQEIMTQNYMMNFYFNNQDIESKVDEIVEEYNCSLVDHSHDLLCEDKTIEKLLNTKGVDKFPILWFKHLDKIDAPCKWHKLMYPHSVTTPFGNFTVLVFPGILFWYTAVAMFIGMFVQAAFRAKAVL